MSVAIRCGRIQCAMCRRACFTASSTASRSAISVSCGDRWPKSAEIASMMSAAWRFVIRASRESRSRRTASDGIMSARAAARIRSSAWRSGRTGSVVRTGSALMASVSGSSVGRCDGEGDRRAGAGPTAHAGSGASGSGDRMHPGRRSRNDNTLAESANSPIARRLRAGPDVAARPGRAKMMLPKPGQRAACQPARASSLRETAG